MSIRIPALRRYVTGTLLVCLQLQACVASVALVLGSRHTHQQSATQSTALDPMAKWQDFRRVSQDDSTRSSRQASEAQHALLHQHNARHHHEAADTSVVKDDVSLVEEAVATDFAQTDAGTVCIKAARTADIAPAVEIFRSRWMTASLPSVPNPRPWRIERPPQVSRVLGTLLT